MRRNRLIATGAAGLLCSLAALGTYAFGAGKNPPKPPTDNAKGGVKVVLSKSSNVLNFQNAVIGDYTQGAVTVSNGGTVAASFRLKGEISQPTSYEALTDRLQLSVFRAYPNAGEVNIYNGSVTGFNAAATGHDLGTLFPAAGAQTPKSVNLRFELSLPSRVGEDDNVLQNIGPFDQRFVFEATQRTTVAGSVRPGTETTVAQNGTFGGSDSTTKDSTKRIRSVATGESRQTQSSSGQAGESGSNLQTASSREVGGSSSAGGAGSDKKADKVEKHEREPASDARREAHQAHGSPQPESVSVASAGERIGAGGWSLTTLLLGGLTIFAAVGLLLTLPTTWGRIR